MQHDEIDRGFVFVSTTGCAPPSTSPPVRTTNRRPRVFRHAWTFGGPASPTRTVPFFRVPGYGSLAVRALPCVKVTIPVPHVTNLLRSPRSGRLAGPPQTVEGRVSTVPAAKERADFFVCRVALHRCQTSMPAKTRPACPVPGVNPGSIPRGSVRGCSVALDTRPAGIPRLAAAGLSGASGSPRLRGAGATVVVRA